MGGKHTPGPWSAEPHLANENEPYIRHFTINAAGLNICHLWSDAKANSDPVAMQANALLIAAAPDLLNALKYVLTAHGEQLHDAFEVACAAIAKAEAA